MQYTGITHVVRCKNTVKHTRLGNKRAMWPLAHDLLSIIVNKKRRVFIRIEQFRIIYSVSTSLHKHMRRRDKIRRFNQLFTALFSCSGLFISTVTLGIVLYRRRGIGVQYRSHVWNFGMDNVDIIGYLFVTLFVSCDLEHKHLSFQALFQSSMKTVKI